MKEIKSFIPYIFMICLLGFNACSSHHETEIIRIESSDQPIESTIHSFFIENLNTKEKIKGFDIRGRELVYVSEKNWGLINLENLENSRLNYNSENFSSKFILDPDFSNSRVLYAIYSDKNSTKYFIGKFKIENAEKLVLIENIYEIPQELLKHSEDIEFTFNQQSNLMFSIPDLSILKHAQDSISPAGKTLQYVNGKIEIYSLGHRFITGFYPKPNEPTIYAVEEGPNGGDELNTILYQKNYGWPEITYGINPDGSIISNSTYKKGLQQPIHYWTPSINPTSLLFYQGEVFSNWKGDLLTWGAKTNRLHRIKLNHNRFREEEQIEIENVEIKNLKLGNDGYIYFLDSRNMSIKRMVSN